MPISWSDLAELNEASPMPICPLGTGEPARGRMFVTNVTPFLGYIGV